MTHLLFSAAAVFLAGLLSWATAYDYGKSKQKAECMQGLHSLQTAINKLNTEAVELAEKQKNSYRIALELRDNDYRRIDGELNTTLDQIEALKHASQDDCVNSRIPDDFK
ncbi:MAG: hypothetical protein RBS36_04195 [Thiomicrospira sp.]|jgi:hypothetical protein|nr:hypothetical protein [Thiomicrospira sp.]